MKAFLSDFPPPVYCNYKRIATISQPLRTTTYKKFLALVSQQFSFPGWCRWKEPHPCSYSCTLFIFFPCCQFILFSSHVS